MKRLLDKTIRILTAALAVLAAPSVGAQPAPTPEEVQQAQVRWNEGKAYFDAGNFEAARVAFKQAYTVFPHAAFLQNLGEAELRTGRNVEAARHFTAFLRAGGMGSPAQRELAKRSLAKASERLGAIVVTTNVDDAEIRVDEELVGRSPLGSLAWYVEPGRHVVTARKDGYLDGSERIDVAIGPPRTVFVRVQRVIGGTSEPPPEEPKPVAPPVASASPPPRVANDRTSGTVSASPDSRSTAVPARSIVLLTGAALTVGAAAVGTVYAIRANADSTRIRNDVMQLEAINPTQPLTVCRDANDPNLTQTCAKYADDSQQLRTDRRARDIAFIGAGVLGAATVATYFIWRPKPAAGVSLVPSLNPLAPGIALLGHF